MRSPVEDHGLVPSLPDTLKSQTHSRVSECDGRPSVQVEPGAVNRMVTASTGVQTDLSKVVHPSCRSICHFPSVKQVSDFFRYLYQDLNKHPLTIDGYRTAIVDTLGPTGYHISQSSDLNRLLFSFHRDCPKSSRNLPKWNLSDVLNELTKAPFEPTKDTDLKHLTLKTAFLLALASGKRCSEIHA